MRQGYRNEKKTHTERAREGKKKGEGSCKRGERVGVSDLIQSFGFFSCLLRRTHFLLLCWTLYSLPSLTLQLTVLLLESAWASPITFSSHLCIRRAGPPGDNATTFRRWKTLKALTEYSRSALLTFYSKNTSLSVLLLWKYLSLSALTQSCKEKKCLTLTLKVNRYWKKRSWCQGNESSVRAEIDRLKTMCNSFPLWTQWPD